MAKQRESFEQFQQYVPKTVILIESDETQAKGSVKRLEHWYVINPSEELGDAQFGQYRLPQFLGGK